MLGYKGLGGVLANTQTWKCVLLFFCHLLHFDHKHTVKVKTLSVFVCICMCCIIYSRWEIKYRGPKSVRQGYLGGILFRCPNNLNWLPLTQKSSNSTPSCSPTPCYVSTQKYQLCTCRCGNFRSDTQTDQFYTAKTDQIGSWGTLMRAMCVQHIGKKKSSW